MKFRKKMSSKSKVWDYFSYATYDGKVDKESTECHICKMKLKYSTGSTSAMAAHMKRKHNINCGGKRSSNSIVTDGQPPVVADKQRKVQETEGEKTTKLKNVATGQLRLNESFAFKNKLGKHSQRHKDITLAIGVMIARDMRPYSIVQNPGFVNLIKTLEPRFEIPSRTHFSEKIIPNLYEETRNKVVVDLKNAKSIAMTTDSWTSRSTESYNTITAHFCTDEYQIKSYVLQTRVLTESHTAENLSELLKTAVSEWDLTRHGEMPALTTDNAKNIMNAGKLAKMTPHLGCVAHSINLATQKGLRVSQLDRLLGRIRRVVGFFHRSTTAMAVLRAKQTLLDLPSHKLIMDVSTRWNSTFDMLERFTEQQPAIEGTLGSKDIRKNAKDVYTLSSDDLSMIEGVLKILKPIKTITTLLCSEKHATASLIHPLKENLIQQLEGNPEDEPLISNVKEAIRNDLQARYNDPAVLQFLHEASFLDPRFKSMPYLKGEEELHELQQAITQKTIDANQNIIIDTTKVKTEPEDSRPNAPPLPTISLDDDTDGDSASGSATDTQTKTSEPKSVMEDLFGEVFITKVDPAKPVTSKVQHEIIAYCEENVLPLNSNPLHWWNINKRKYPALSTLVKKYLSIPATSVASERVFSTAGDLVTAERSCLSPDHIDKLIFLKKNME